VFRAGRNDEPVARLDFARRLAFDQQFAFAFLYVADLFARMRVAADGGAGSAYVPQAYGSNWFGKQQPRGAWQYSGEIDLGFSGALRDAAVIVAEDPIFGRIAYGGDMRTSRGETAVVPQDGVGQRFHLLDGTHRVHLILNRDGFAQSEPVRFEPAVDRGLRGCVRGRTAPRSD